MTHDPTLQTTDRPQLFQIQCSCGWLGPWTRNKHTSVTHFNHHVAAEDLAARTRQDAA